MGMFDWYRPSGELECPVCGVVLKEWQGKDGPNALFVWSEGEEVPVDQPIDEDAKISEEARRAFRLPQEFQIYSYDCQSHRVLAECRTRDDIWSETSILSATAIGV
jgi:hypothetical protein